MPLQRYPVCAVGASAGGLGALIDFFRRVPSDSGVAFLVIQHCSPDHKSMVSELLAPHVKLPIVEVSERTLLKPNTICLCSPGMIPHANGYEVWCEPRREEDASRLPIDHYFDQLGRSLGESAIGVILSGTGSDGSQGLRSIGDNGGIVVVQEPTDAEFAEMPRSALLTGKASAVAPASELWEVISNLIDERNSEREDVSEEVAEIFSNDAKEMEGSISRIAELEKDLRATRKHLEKANEELQATNEELQCTIEELHTVNTEFERKNKELMESNVTLQNLLESSEDGILFIDRNLLIRNFNPAIAAAFNLLPGDLGRSVKHIAYHLSEGEGLTREVRQVIQSGERMESETRDRNGRHYLKRIVPFRRADGGIEGALISFTNVTRYHDLEDRFNFALEAVGMSWWDWDLKSGRLDVNSAGKCLLGDDCLAVARDKEGWMAMVHPDDSEEVARSLDAHLEGKTDTWTCEHRFKTTDENWLWVLNSGKVLDWSDDGNPLRMIGTTQDVHSYKEAIIRISDQNELLGAASKIAGLGTWEYDPNIGSLYWSEQVKKIMGVDSDHHPLVETAFDCFPHPDREVLESAFEKLLKEGVPYDLEIRCVNRNGENLLTRAAAMPSYDERGRLIKVLGLFQDITDITRTEHEMEAYFSLSPDLQATLDFEGSLKSFSNTWISFFGLSREELTGMPLVELIHPDNASRFSEVLAEVMNGKIVNSHETRTRPGDADCDNGLSEEHWMSWSLSSDKQLGLIFVSARCVTEQ